MEFGWSDEFDRFRADVKKFINDTATPELMHEIEEADAEGGAQRSPLMKKVRDDIDNRGWMKIAWPEELGGQGKSPWYPYILSEEMQMAGIPYSLGVAAMIGPAIQKFGTDQQKADYLPKLWSQEMTAALGYSEPNAGTDLASLETKAIRDGDEYVINGQKIWTSGAHMSTHVWLAARTDPSAPKHRGVSMFIVPLDSPGISVRPIWTMAGSRTNETFYEDVRVPASALIGEENRGWYIAANALDHERVTIGGYTGLAAQYERLMHHLKTKRPEILKDRAARLRLAEVKLDLKMVHALTLTNADIIAHGATPTMQASMVKFSSSELRYRMNSIAMDLLGRSGALSKESGDIAPEGGVFDQTYRSSPILRFGGGTNEIQRNIVAQRGLGLPRA